MARQAEEWEWDIACIDAFVPPDDGKDWDECPKCHVLPRIWVFDNGRYAKCLCSKGKYIEAEVSAEDIMTVHRRDHGDTTNYDVDALRKAWNARCSVESAKMVTYEFGYTIRADGETKSVILSECGDDQFVEKCRDVREANKLEAGPNIRGLVRPSNTTWWLRVKQEKVNPE